MARCRQCGKPAIVDSLCVDHYHTWVETNYMLSIMMASQMNSLQERISAGTGGLIPPRRIVIPPLPSSGDNVTFNNINVDRSTIGAINTGTLKHLEVGISVMQGRGDKELAAAIKELTQAIYDSKEVDDSSKNDILDQLQFIIAQATAEPENRSTGLVKGMLAGIRSSISVVASLLAIWDRVEPLIKMALGIS